MEWIDIREQRPVVYEDVLVFVPSEDMPLVGVGYMYPDELFEVYGYSGLMDDIRWWVPLPDPPKRGGE